jgi:hypothetical protein
MRGWLLWPLLVSIGVGCSRATASEQRGVNESNQSATEGKGTQRGTRGKQEVTSPTQRKAEVTPALARKAEEILRKNEDAPLGTEIPFTLDGQRYVARFEEHDNPEGDPGRPAGKHKGVTVYVSP